MKKYHLSIALLAIAFHTKGQFNTTATANVATTNARYVWAGNVGVGTAQNVVPSEKLHVIGTIRSNSFNSTNGIFSTIGATNLNLYTNSLATDGTGGTVRATILNSNGFMGIGIGTPSEMLHVNNSARATRFNSGTGFFSTVGATNLSLSTNALAADGTGGTVRTTILNSNGYMGIGTATPSEMLHVNSSARATRFNSGTGFFSTIGATNLSLSTDALAADGTGGTVRATILSTSGFMGIGTATPAEMLHVNSSARASVFNSTSGVFASNGATNISFNTNTSTADGTGGTARATILNSNGFMGIGTANPAEMLHVNSSVRGTRFNAGTGIFSSVGASNLSFNTNAATDGTGGSTWMTVANTGNVGIGSTATAPISKLQVDVASNNMSMAGLPVSDYGLFLKNTDNTVNNLNVIGFGNSVGTSVANVGAVISDQTATGAGSLFFSTKPSTGTMANRMIINSVGNVGIGTTIAGLSSSADYKLAVNGKILAKDLQIQVSHPTWADYVFDPSYQLPALTEVEQYIKENKHLKDVPSADDVEKEGYSVGELDVVLLKKVEELTLYVIAQQKEIEALKKEISKKK
jgi:Phage T4 tail fibre